ncbi:MAG: hypothetical protein WBA61_01160 [Aequorivita sp.]
MNHDARKYEVGSWKYEVRSPKHDGLSYSLSRFFIGKGLNHDGLNQDGLNHDAWKYERGSGQCSVAVGSCSGSGCRLWG